MSRYIDWQDAINKYTGLAKVGGEVEMKQSYINASEDEVDALLAPAYSVPFTPCPGVVRDLCIDLTYYKAMILQKGSQVVKDYFDSRIASILGGKLMLTNSDGVISQNTMQAARTAYVSSVQPVGGMSTENEDYFDTELG